MAQGRGPLGAGYEPPATGRGPPAAGRAPSAAGRLHPATGLEFISAKRGFPLPTMMDESQQIDLIEKFAKGVSTARQTSEFYMAHVHTQGFQELVHERLDRALGDLRIEVGTFLLLITDLFDQNNSVDRLLHKMNVRVRFTSESIDIETPPDPAMFGRSVVFRRGQAQLVAAKVEETHKKRGHRRGTVDVMINLGSGCH